MSENTTASIAQYLVKSNIGLLEAIMQDITPEQAHWIPPGTANPIGATYAHVVIAHDGIFNGKFKQQAPLYVSEWAGKTGMSELPPPMEQGLPNWSEWARSVQIDMDALRSYANAVYTSADAFLETLTDAYLEETLGTIPGLGELTVGQYLFLIAIGHITMHVGELGCLRGLQGLRGLPI